MKLPIIRKSKINNKQNSSPVFASDIRQSINPNLLVSNQPEKHLDRIVKSPEKISKKDKQTFAFTHPYVQEKKLQRKKIRFIHNLKENSRNKGVFISIITVSSVALFVLIFLSFANISNTSNNDLANPLADPEKIEVVEKVLTENNIKFEALEYKENHFEFILKDGVRVLMSDKKIGEDVSSLQLITERFKIEGRRLTLIDLRFDKPVIR